MYNNLKCKYCNSNNINKIGKRNNKQRYLCRNCNGNFYKLILAIPIF